jgi:hypothetical protein
MLVKMNYEGNEQTAGGITGKIPFFSPSLYVVF